MLQPRVPRGVAPPPDLNRTSQQQWLQLHEQYAERLAAARRASMNTQASQVLFDGKGYG